ncbi:MAG: hypothetical protein K6E36_11205 [Oscillospiraceae bacterium]|nr:hypothetical protein [Oscillospiraceae bacterium]
MKKLKFFLTAAAAVLMTGTGMLHASAEGSVQDVYNAMRRIGLPESMVQQAKNTYESRPEMHDENGMTINGQYGTYLDWADNIIVMEDTIWKKLAEQYQVPVEKIKEYLADQPKQTTTPAETSGNGSATTTVTTVTTARKSDSKFINMTAEEKKQYLLSMTEEERVRFLANLTNAERKSIIKQLSADDKADLMKDFAEIGKSLGMNITVDNIDKNDISYSVRDENGNLIDSSSVGTRVDDTGWDLTVPVLGSAGLILLSAGGLVLMTVRAGRRKAEADA